jgi:hypothetical protein
LEGICDWDEGLREMATDFERYKRKEDEEEDEIGSHYSVVTSFNSIFIFIERVKGFIYGLVRFDVRFVSCSPNGSLTLRSVRQNFTRDVVVDAAAQSICS